MISVAVAFVLATALAIAFKQTRTLGVVGYFILLCISPLFFGGLLVLAGAVYYYFTFWHRKGRGASGRLPSPLSDDRPPRGEP